VFDCVSLLLPALEQIQEAKEELLTKRRLFIAQKLNPDDIIDHLISVGCTVREKISNPYYTPSQKNEMNGKEGLRP